MFTPILRFVSLSQYRLNASSSRTIINIHYESTRPYGIDGLEKQRDEHPVPDRFLSLRCKREFVPLAYGNYRKINVNFEVTVNVCFVLIN